MVGDGHNDDNTGGIPSQDFNKYCRDDGAEGQHRGM